MEGAAEFVKRILASPAVCREMKGCFEKRKAENGKDGLSDELQNLLKVIEWFQRILANFRGWIPTRNTVSTTSCIRWSQPLSGIIVLVHRCLTLFY